MASRYYYSIEVEHAGLHKYRLIKGADEYVVEQKAAAQLAVWDEMWDKKCEIEERKQEREKKTKKIEDNMVLAEKKTDEAREEIEKLKNTLNYTLDFDDKVDWNKLKSHKKYSKKKPLLPVPISTPIEPLESDEKYIPQLGILDRIFTSRKFKIISAIDRAIEQDHAEWKNKMDTIHKEDENNILCYNQDLNEWEEKKKKFEVVQNKANRKIEQLKKKYLDCNENAVYEYCDLVLTNSRYPDYFPKNYDLEYNGENKLLIVDYFFPSLEDIPTLLEVKFVKTKSKFNEKHITESAKNKLYDNLLYQISLRTIHELYEADVVNALSSIVFNGWVNFLDKATGKREDACILSLQAEREEFLSINLQLIEPKMCFKNLKGVGSGKLFGMVAVAPILKIDKEDKRFVQSKEVVNNIDQSLNLAAMDWGDFEHLIRELFEKEFATSGGEVKVTQASRDGGVDAIAFDPDPIRGGKIVIQAKRYTNVVGVSAVRDLYGTVMNEGAIKGILITTSNYGSDAFKFAKGKPLTLMTGANLLHLLKKHGHKATIDLKEAKKILSEKEDSGE